MESIGIWSKANCLLALEDSGPAPKKKGAYWGPSATVIVVLATASLRFIGPYVP